jgi:hypothetical protein
LFSFAYPGDISEHQAAKDVGSDHETLIVLLESIERFLNRLDIYTKIPLTVVMAEVIVKIMVELLSTLALVTKHIKQKRPGETVLTCTRTWLIAMQ